jgi:polyprenyl-phospho-N-acetylgalactosaminyl synthase
MNNKFIIVIIPAHNEEANIASTIDDLNANNYQSLIVIDDGSNDATFAIASRRAYTLRHSIRRGYGAALTTGMEEALRLGADIVVHFDGDGQYQARDIAALTLPIREGTVNVVFGSRYLSRTTSVPWSKKYLIHKPALLAQQLINGLTFTDIHNGFRAFSRLAAEQMNMRQDGMAYSSEIIAELKKNKMTYREIPVKVKYNTYGQGFSAGIKIYSDLIIKKLFK